MARRGNQRRRGIIRDDHGVVLAVNQRHPMLDVFTAIPLSDPELPDGGNLPPINWPTEMKQVAAVHFYENLYPGLPAPLPPGVKAHLVTEDGSPIVDDKGRPVVIGPSKYRLVNPTGDDRLTMGGAGETWLSWKIEASEVQRAAAETMAEVGPAHPLPNVDEMDEQQLQQHQYELRQQQLAVEARLTEHERAAQLDVPLESDRAVPPPAFGNWVKRNEAKLREQGMPDHVVDKTLDRIDPTTDEGGVE